MPTRQLEWFLSEVLLLQRHVHEFLTSRAEELASVHPSHRSSAENLLAYTALRQRDLRKLQLALSQRGLSSLGSCEGHVLSSLEELRSRLEESLSRRSTEEQPGPPPATWSDAERTLHRNTQSLLGDKPTPRHVHIMVTAPDDAPDEVACASLLSSGMSVLRINTAHGTPEAWQKTAENARRAASGMNRSLRILVDLEGPKIRTAPITPGPAVVRYRPRKDPLGRVVQALRVLILGESAFSSPGEPPLRVPDTWVPRLRVGDVIFTHDSRDRPREFRVVEITQGAAVAELTRSAYLTPDSILSLRRDGHELESCPAPGIRELPGVVEVRQGDELQLWLEPIQGLPGVRHPTEAGRWLRPPRIGVDAAGVSIELKPGHRVLIDDGKIEATVIAVNPPLTLLKIVRTARQQGKISGDKGINFPDSTILASALSAQDRSVLPGVLSFADLLGISFVRTPADLRQALDTIKAQPGGEQVGVVLKLETAYALQTLPELLLEAMRHHPVGVMIARGDLAVEVGFERLAEVQQEILWFCEAAHLPVIWATQVLDTLTHTGIPSRAEITDASMSVQAECVMLNKGPYVIEACRTLDSILRKMEQHQYKKRNLYRPLRISMPKP